MLSIKNPFGPRCGIVIFSKIPLVNPKFISYSYPKKVFVPLYTKLAQQGILSAEFKNLSLRIATTHLSSDNVHDLKPKNKLYNLIHTQSQQAVVFANKYSKNESLILAGDFNIAKDSILYQELLENAKVIDVFAREDTPSYFPDRVSYFYRAPADRCDFIFYKSQKNKINVLST